MIDQTTTADNKIEMHKLIGKHIGTMWGGLAQSSIENFLQTSKVSGSFLIALQTMMQEYASLQNAEKQKEIDSLKEENARHLLNLTDILERNEDQQKEIDELKIKCVKTELILKDCELSIIHASINCHPNDKNKLDNILERIESLNK